MAVILTGIALALAGCGSNSQQQRIDAECSHLLNQATAYAQGFKTQMAGLLSPEQMASHVDSLRRADMNLRELKHGLRGCPNP